MTNVSCWYWVHDYGLIHCLFQLINYYSPYTSSHILEDKCDMDYYIIEYVRLEMGQIQILILVIFTVMKRSTLSSFRPKGRPWLDYFFTAKNLLRTFSSIFFQHLHRTHIGFLLCQFTSENTGNIIPV